MILLFAHRNCVACCCPVRPGIAIQAVSGAGSWQVMPFGQIVFSDVSDVSVAAPLRLQNADQIQYFGDWSNPETATFTYVGEQMGFQTRDRCSLRRCSVGRQERRQLDWSGCDHGVLADSRCQGSTACFLSPLSSRVSPQWIGVSFQLTDQLPAGDLSVRSIPRPALF